MIRGLVATIALSLALVAPVAADSIDRARLAELARRAADDPVALAELERVTRVDGRPVDLRAALHGAGRSELRARLAALERAQPGSATLAGPRAEAARILRQERFTGDAPSRGVVQRVLSWVGSLFRLPGGSGTASKLVVLALAVVGLALVASVVTAVSRRDRARARRERTLAETTADPAQLERDADAAEARGDLERAIRLRVAAALVRLDRARRIELHPDTTVGATARRLRSPAFRGVASVFESVVYGRRAPASEDLRTVRDGIAETLEEPIR